jgi:hypothetical protein
MLNFLNISIDELSIIGLTQYENYLDLFKKVRNFLYTRPPKVTTIISRNTGSIIEYFPIDAYILSSELYNKFLPEVFPDGYPLYIRTKNVKYFFDLITQIKDNVQFDITFFATIKPLPLNIIIKQIPKFSLDFYNVKTNKYMKMPYLGIIPYLQLCTPTIENINNIHVFTLHNSNIYYSSINEDYNRKANLLTQVRNVYMSVYLVPDEFY